MGRKREMGRGGPTEHFLLLSAMPAAVWDFPWGPECKQTLWETKRTNLLQNQPHLNSWDLKQKPGGHQPISPSESLIQSTHVEHCPFFSSSAQQCRLRNIRFPCVFPPLDLIIVLKSDHPNKNNPQLCSGLCTDEFNGRHNVSKLDQRVQSFTVFP